MLTVQSAILASRKRKLRELFAVTTQIEPLPQDALDKPSVSAAEWQFLQANDIQQYVLFASETHIFFFFAIFASHLAPSRGTEVGRCNPNLMMLRDGDHHRFPTAQKIQIVN